MNEIFIIWGIISFVSIVFELFWPGFFFFLSFAIGSAFAGFVNFLGYSLEAQLFIFFIVTFISFFILRKWVKKSSHDTLHKTNVYALVGKTGIVTQDIEPLKKGFVKINGEIWSALSSQEGAFYAKNTIVEVVGVKGINVIVTAK